MYSYPRYILLLSLCLLVELGCTALLLQLQAASSSSKYTYVGARAILARGTSGPLPPIRMNIEPTKHYQLSGPAADAGWAALAPHAGTLHLGPHRGPYRDGLSLFHQLRCLDVIRRGIVVGSGSPPSASSSRLNQHCLNYMRQMVLCRADLALDPVLAGRGREHEARVRADTNLCVDWRRVYEELEKNQQEYARWAAEHHQAM